MNREEFVTLCELDGLPGYENAVRDYILQQLNKYPTPKEITVDNMGNVLVHLIGKEPANKVVQFDAHMDEVGFIVTHICDDGTLRFATLGGISDQALFGHRVRIGKQCGIIGGKAVHQCKGQEKEKLPAASEMCIDIGCCDADSACALVKVGDVGTFAAGITWFNENIFCGKAVDDRIGCALLLDLAKEQPARDIWLSFSVQEELGLRGAGVATEQIKPDFAVAIDATTAADTAGNSGDDKVCCVGGGAVVPFADGATLYDSALRQKVNALAAANDISVQVKTKIAGANNAGAMQRRHTGVYTTCVSLPCRYIHSPCCLGSVQDVECMRKLLSLLAEELTR